MTQRNSRGIFERREKAEALSGYYSTLHPSTQYFRRNRRRLIDRATLFVKVRIRFNFSSLGLKPREPRAARISAGYLVYHGTIFSQVRVARKAEAVQLEPSRLS